MEIFYISDISEIKEENKKHRQYYVGGVFISLILAII